MEPLGDQRAKFDVPRRSRTSTPPTSRRSCARCGPPARPLSTGGAGRGRSRRRTGSPTSSGCGRCSGAVGADAGRSRWCRRRATGSRWPPATSACPPATASLVLAEEYPSGSTPGERRRAGGRRDRHGRPRAAGSHGPTRCSPCSTSGSRRQRSERALDRRGARRPRRGRGARPRGRCPARDRRSQSVGAMPLDVGDLRPDYLISVGYKWLLGPLRSATCTWPRSIARRATRGELDLPSGIGGLRAARRLPRRIPAGCAALRRRRANQVRGHPDGDRRLEQLVAWQVTRIAAKLATVTEEIARGARELGLDPPPADQRGPHMLGLAAYGRRSPSASLRVLAENGCYAAVRGGSLRIAPHLHTSADDVERLLAALAQAVRDR